MNLLKGNGDLFIKEPKGGIMMKTKTLVMGMVVCVAVSLALGMPLWAGEKDIHKGIGGEPEKVITPEKPNISPRLKIIEFSCTSRTGGYNIALFEDFNKLSVNYDLYGSQGLERFEIYFRGHLVHNVVVMGGLTTFNQRYVLVDLSPYRPKTSGTYNLEGKLFDRRRNVVTKSISLRVDLERPEITRIQPGDGETIYTDLERTDITWDIEATDDFSRLGEARVIGRLVGSRGSTDWEGIDRNPPYRITIRDVDVGTSLWKIEVKDNAGNSSRQSRRIIVTPIPARDMR